MAAQDFPVIDQIARRSWSMQDLSDSWRHRVELPPAHGGIQPWSMAHRKAAGRSDEHRDRFLIFVWVHSPAPCIEPSGEALEDFLHVLTGLWGCECHGDSDRAKSRAYQ